jgi:hypothetical protein
MRETPVITRIVRRSKTRTDKWPIVLLLDAETETGPVGSATDIRRRASVKRPSKIAAVPYRPSVRLKETLRSQMGWFVSWWCSLIGGPIRSKALHAH